MIKSVYCVAGREKVNMPVPLKKEIKYLEVKLSGGKSFDIEIDQDGDVVITGSHNIKVVADDENQIIIKIK